MQRWVSICLAPPNQVQNMILFSMKFTLFIILPKKFPLKNSASQVGSSRCVLKHACGCWMVFEKRGPYLSLQSARPPKIMCLMRARTNRAMRHFHSMIVIDMCTSMFACFRKIFTFYSTEMSQCPRFVDQRSMCLWCFWWCTGIFVKFICHMQCTMYWVH